MDGHATSAENLRGNGTGATAKEAAASAGKDLQEKLTKQEEETKKRMDEESKKYDEDTGHGRNRLPQQRYNQKYPQPTTPMP